MNAPSDWLTHQLSSGRLSHITYDTAKSTSAKKHNASGACENLPSGYVIMTNDNMT